MAKCLQKEGQPVRLDSEMMPMVGNGAASSSERTLVPVAMPAESLEQRIVSARQVQIVLGGHVAMEIAVHERSC